MFIIQQRNSVGRAALLAFLLEFVYADNSISNRKICGCSNRRSISYLEVDSGDFNWVEAWSVCNNYTYTLPVICDQTEQDALTNYLKTMKGISPVWMSGRKLPFNNWTWVDGFIHTGVIRLNEARYETYTHGYLTLSRTYATWDPITTDYYICQYSGSLCNSDDIINVTKGCLRPSDDSRNWYDARNRCLDNGGDLAILTDADLETLKRNNKLNSQRMYWIGLRRNAWYLTSHVMEPLQKTDEEIKYSNWAEDAQSLMHECISIDASNGQWKTDRCTAKKKVVCQTSSDKMTSSQCSSTTSRSMLSMNEVATQRATNVDFQILHSLLACLARESSSVSYSTFVAVVIGGLSVIVILVIILAFGARKLHLRKANASSSSSAEPETKPYQDLDSTYTEIQLQPVYEEVSQRGH